LNAAKCRILIIQPPYPNGIPNSPVRPALRGEAPRTKIAPPPAGNSGPLPRQTSLPVRILPLMPDLLRAPAHAPQHRPGTIQTPVNGEMDRDQTLLALLEKIKDELKKLGRWETNPSKWARKTPIQCPYRRLAERISPLNNGSNTSFFPMLIKPSKRETAQKKAALASPRFETWMETGRQSIW
jgi:hypothetical protein